MVWIENSLVVFVLFGTLHLADAALCGNNKFGEDKPDSKDDEIDSNTDYGYMMGDPDYIVDCCGIVDRWEAEFDNVAGTRTIYFQVWRPVSGTTYELVGQNSMTVNSDGEQDVDIAQNQRITIKANDRWGWWTSGTDIVTYKKGNNEQDQNSMMTLASMSEGDTQNWGGASVIDERSYGIRMDTQDNNDPHFTNLASTVTIPATTASGTSIYTVSVDDIDTYDVSSLTTVMTANSDYSFDTSTLILTTANTFSVSAVDNLKFVVTDQCGNTATSTLTVSITNQPPTITSLPMSGTISEDATVETLLHTINVTDPEGTTTTCSLASTVPASAPFNVRVVSATDYGIYSDSSPGFDYSTTKSYTITVDCTDGEFTDSETFTAFIIQNTPPIFINLQNSTSVSTTTPVGTTAFTVLVDDTDDVTYTMTCNPSPCPFTIFSSGQIQVSEDLSGHTTVGYDLSITVTDGRNTVGPKILTITIADINDPVTITNLPVTLTVAENTNIATSVYTVSYNDIDTSQTHTITMSSAPSTGLSYFSIDTSTGLISTIGQINYESVPTTTFVFDVTVSDPVVSDTKSLTIEIVNENEAPTFSQSSYSISASEGTAGTSIGTPSFGISDPDTGDTYTLTNDCGSDTGYFIMDSSSGEVSFQSDYDLDTGSLPSTVNCIVTVTDSGALTSTASLIITISDANDNTPVFSPTTYSFYVSYYANAGTSVGVITATDADSGAYGVITYTLDQTSLALEHFAVSNTGEITVKTTPKGSVMGYATSVTLTATASDIGGQSDTATVVIVISDTTTTSTTTTTDRYRTFIEDPKNIAWLSACVVVAIVSFFVLVYVIFTCHGDKGCAKFRRNCRGPRKAKRRTFDRFPESRSDYRDSPPQLPRSLVGGSIRNPPPPVELQAWRGRPI